jgi:hypothetical protein
MKFSRASERIKLLLYPPQVVKRDDEMGHSAILGRRTSDDSRTLYSLGFPESLPCVERRLVRHAANSLHDDRRLDVSHRKGVEFSYRQKKVEVIGRRRVAKCVIRVKTRNFFALLLQRSKC